jgi:hypothetical protein
MDLHKPNNKLVSAYLKHFWCTNEPWTNTDSQDSPQPELGGNHHFPPYSIFCVWSQYQHPNVILFWDFQDGVPKFLKLRLSQLWRLITLCANLGLKWGSKKIYSPCRDLFNNRWHVICAQGNQSDSWLLVVGNQIGYLIPDLSFGHNLCFKCPNGSWEPILNIYVPRAFRW